MTSSASAGPDSGRWTHDLYQHQNSIDARLGPGPDRSSRQQSAPTYASHGSSSSSRPTAGPRRSDIQTRLGPGRPTDSSGSRVGAVFAQAAASAARSAARSTRGSGAGEAINTGAKLVIENLHFEVTETDLKELFEPFNITSAHIHYDHTDRSLGRALLTFPARTDALAAREKYNGMLLDDKPMALRDVDASLDSALLRLAAPKRPAPAFADRQQTGGGADGRWEQRGQQQGGRGREYQQSGGRRDEETNGRWQQKGGVFDLRQELGFRTKDLRRDAATRSRSRSRSRSRDRRPSSRKDDMRRGGRGARDSSRSRSRSRSHDRRDRPKFTFVPDSDSAAKPKSFAFVEQPRRYTRRAGEDVEDGELDEGEVYVSSSAVRRERGREPVAATATAARGAEAEGRMYRGRGDRREVRGRDVDAMEID